MRALAWVVGDLGMSGKGTLLIAVCLSLEAAVGTGEAPLVRVNFWDEGPTFNMWGLFEPAKRFPWLG
jgi:hypothetical protein